MSQDTVELVRRSFDARNAGDMDAFRELHDPDVLARMVEVWPEPGPFVGREAVMREFQRLRETWDAERLEPISDFIEAGNQVAVRFIWHGVGRGPDASIEMTYVATLRKGKIHSIEYFWDHAEALEAAGISE